MKLIIVFIVGIICWPGHCKGRVISEKQVEVEETTNSEGIVPRTSSLDFLTFLSSLMNPSGQTEPNSNILSIITSRLHSVVSSVQSFLSNTRLGQLSLFRRLRGFNNNEVEFVEPVVRELDRLKKTLEMIQGIEPETQQSVEFESTTFLEVKQPPTTTIYPESTTSLDSQSNIRTMFNRFQKEINTMVTRMRELFNQRSKPEPCSSENCGRSVIGGLDSSFVNSAIFRQGFDIFKRVFEYRNATYPDGELIKSNEIKLN